MVITMRPATAAAATATNLNLLNPRPAPDARHPRRASSFLAAFSPRLRYVVMDSGETLLGQWVKHERDLAADFLRAFGAETDVMPPLVGLAVGADSDNTQSTSLAYVGDLGLVIAPSVISNWPAAPSPVKP